LSKKTHHIILKDFPLESGEISFNALQKVTGMLQVIAGGALRIVVEGASSKKGPSPKWLREAVNFNLSGMSKGSTDLVVKAPMIKDSIENPQIPMFGRSPDFLLDYTGVDLSLEALQQAFREDEGDDLLDKSLLNKMEKFHSLFKNHEGTMEITGHANKQTFKITGQSFNNLKTLKNQTPEPQRVKISGILDEMKHSKERIQLMAEGGNIRAFLPENISFRQVKKYFGQQATVEGIANFRPNGKIKTIQVSGINRATEKDGWFTKPQKPISKQLNLNQLRREQGHEGTKLDNVIGGWPGDESIEQLLKMRKK